MITGMLAIVTIGFLAGLIVSPPDPAGALGGLRPDWPAWTAPCWPSACSARP